MARTLAALVRRRKTTFKQAVNDALRAGLGLDSPPARRGRFVVVPHGGGFGAGVDPRKLNQLAGELEDEATLSSLARR